MGPPMVVVKVMLCRGQWNSRTTRHCPVRLNVVDTYRLTVAAVRFAQRWHGGSNAPGRLACRHAEGPRVGVALLPTSGRQLPFYAGYATALGAQCNSRLTSWQLRYPHITGLFHDAVGFSDKLIFSRRVTNSSASSTTRSAITCALMTLRTRARAGVRIVAYGSCARSARAALKSGRQGGSGCGGAASRQLTAASHLPSR